MTQINHLLSCITHLQKFYSVQFRKVIWGKSSSCLSRGGYQNWRFIYCNLWLN